MNVLLINPTYRTKLGSCKDIEVVLPPTGLTYLAAVLRQNNINVEILDLNAEPDRKIDKNYDFVGITAVTPAINAAFKLAESIKKQNPKTKIALGGPHPSSLPKQCIKNPNIDYVVVGEGESVIVDLVKGKIKRRIIYAPFIEDLNSLPFPAIDLLSLHKYKSNYTKSKKFMNILTSRGCPARCIYCNKLSGYKFRARSPENIIKEIEYLIENYNYKEFHILDDTFTMDKQRVINFCNLILEKKLKIFWKCGNGLRVNTVDYELLKLMKKAGCYSVSFGIESGNQDILNSIKKGITLQQCRDAIKASKDAGLFTIGFFMIGNLGETRETMQQTIDFAKELDPHLAQFSILIPFPGTEVRKEIIKNGKLLINYWEDYDNISGNAVFEYKNLTKSLLEEMFKKAYREFYLRPNYITKRILGIRSLLDIKTYVKGAMTILK